MGIKKNLHNERAVRHQNRLPRVAEEFPSLELFKRCVDMAYNGTWFTGDLGSVRLMVGLSVLKGLF